MPPRRSAAVERESASSALPFPAPVVHAVFAQLSAADRGRCACVSRAWRAAVADPALWARLVLEKGQGDAVLLGASAAARGGLTHLNISAACARVTLDAVTRVAAANAASLLELRYLDSSAPARLDRVGCRYVRPETCTRLVHTAPRLRELHANVACSSTQASALLAGDGALVPLRLRRLLVVYHRRAPEAPLVGLLNQLGAHEPLRELGLTAAPLAADGALDALVAAATARRLEELELVDCPWPGSAARFAGALTRLLDGCATALRKLVVFGSSSEYPRHWLDRQGCALVAEALRRHASLRYLYLGHMLLWDAEPGVGVALLRAATGHPSLASLGVGDTFGSADERANRAAGAALGALVAADAPALRQLSLSRCGLSGRDLEPLCAALARNTHLEWLSLAGNELQPAFINGHLMPSVRSNCSLRKLNVADDRNAAPDAWADAAADAQAWVDNARRARGPGYFEFDDDA